MLNVNRKIVGKLLVAATLATAFAFSSVSVNADPQDNTVNTQQVKKKHAPVKKQLKRGQQKKQAKSKTLKDCPSCWNG